MDRPRYHVLPGTFVAQGYAPDGDSIRFAPDRLAALDELPGTLRLRVAKDTSVQLRLEGIDAPELHYLAHAQRLGDAARDALLHALAIDDAHVEHDFVTRARYVRGTILTRSIDPNGRVIAYAFRHVAPLHVRSSVNAEMLRAGMAYPLAYDTQPAEDRRAFAAIARLARMKKLGVWAIDRTPAFPLATERSIGPHGALIFPKLFRRCLAYVSERLSGFRGDFRAWLEGEAGADNDVVIVRGRLMRLSALVEEVGREVRTRVDGARVVFVAR
ncbi:MAG: thermonuclease family protein [Deltaproteobacteria bacterium]|nr:thermonuclease family protein [Deltaproteobacteria bacterium]